MVGSGSWGYTRKTVGNTFSSETHVIECQVIGGWKGWKKITVYWKIWGKWLENHIQIAEFWLEFFLMVCGNPVVLTRTWFKPLDFSRPFVCIKVYLLG